MNRIRQPSNLSFGNSPWSSRHTDNTWGERESSTPTSQYFGVSDTANQGRYGVGAGLGHRDSNEKINSEGVRLLWPDPTGC